MSCVALPLYQMLRVPHSPCSDLWSIADHFAYRRCAGPVRTAMTVLGLGSIAFDATEATEP